MRKRLEDRDAWLEQYLAESDIAEVYDPAWRGTIDRGLNEEAGTLIEVSWHRLRNRLLNILADVFTSPCIHGAYHYHGGRWRYLWRYPRAE